MAKLVSFQDNKSACFANTQMDNGDPVWISIAQTGILVKKSRLGMFGAKLYEEKNVYKAVETAKALCEQYPNDITPEGISNPVLKSVVNAVLHCYNSAQVAIVLNEALHKKQKNENIEPQTTDSFKQNLLLLRNQLFKEEGLDGFLIEPNNIESAVKVFLITTLIHVQTQSGQLPLKGRIEESDAIIGVIFLLFLFALVNHNLKSEGVHLSDEVLPRAISHAYQFLDAEQIVEIFQKGGRQYKELINSETCSVALYDFHKALEKTLLAYVMTKDDKVLDSFSALYKIFGDAFKKAYL